MIFLELLAGITIVGLVLYKGIQLQRGLGSAQQTQPGVEHAAPSTQLVDAPSANTTQPNSD